MPTLVVTINGPFAYVGNYYGRLTLMAPLCAQHMAGISSVEANQQVVLHGCNNRNHQGDLGDCAEHLYRFQFYPGYVSTSVPHPENFLTCPMPPSGFNGRHWRLWITLPMPEIIIPIAPVHAQIIRGAQQQSEGDFAIGVQLVYKHWDGHPATLEYFKNGSPAQNEQGSPIFPVKFDFCDYLATDDDHVHVEIEYAGPLRDDSGHEDAVDCFETLMKNLGLDWSIFIPPFKPAFPQHPNLLSSKLNDCMAAVAWVGSLPIQREGHPGQVKRES